MAKVFNQNRLEMLKKSRFTNYILYAIGEIFLVIVGILIALQIDKKAEQKKTRDKVTALMKVVQDDLLSDITQANNVLQFYDQEDSLIDFVLNNELTMQDYGRNPRLLGLITQYKPYTVNAQGYENLMRYGDYIPTRFDSVLPLLDQIYITNVKTLDYINEQLSQFVSSTLEGWSEEYTWYADYSMNKFNQEAVDYLLKDPFYKNKVVVYKTYAIENLLRSARTHELTAVLAYKRIANALEQEDVPKIVQDYMVDLSDADANKLSGTYAFIPTFKVNIFQRNGQLYMQATGQEAFELFAKSNTQLFNPMLDVKILVNLDENDNVESLNLLQMGQDLLFKKESIE